MLPVCRNSQADSHLWPITAASSSTSSAARSASVAPQREGHAIRRPPVGRRLTDWSGRRSSAGAAERDAARWLLWEIGQAVGVRPASIGADLLRPWPGRVRRIHRPGDQRADAGLRHGARDLPGRARRDGGAILLEIARSEIAYTDQRPAEYVAVIIGGGAARGLRPSRSSSRATTAR